MTLRSREQEAFATALRARRPLAGLRAAAKRILRRGMPRNYLMTELEEFRLEVRHGARPEDEELVLDVMDFVDGWASPHAKI